MIYSELIKHYPDVVGIDVTRRLELKMKDIEEGRADYQEILRELYRELNEKVINNEEVNQKLLKMWNDFCGGIQR